MKQILKILSVLFFCTISGQRLLPVEKLKFEDVTDLFADDYGNLYLYQNKDFSFTKYDSVGKQQAKLMLTLPFRIQSVQNILNIPSFSENAQELRFFDQNLNQIQTINFRQKFGYIKMAYVEDLQQAWLLDESSKRLIQYHFREDKILNSLSFDINFEQLVDLLIFEKTAYFLFSDHLLIYNFKAEKIAEIALEQGRKLRRENDRILILTTNSALKLEEGILKEVFKADHAQIVDKNSTAYFGIKENKLYLYPIEKELSPGK